MASIIILRGGGDLASGVALRLYRSGIQVVIAELPEPLAVRRLVSFSEAIYAGEIQIEAIPARRSDRKNVAQLLASGVIPVLVDPDLHSSLSLPSLGLQVAAIVDGRMLKRSPAALPGSVPLLIGLGPGFVAGENCDVVVETNRGHNLGRVIWQGAPELDTGIPESVQRYGAERVLRAPVAGVISGLVEICAHLEPGDRVARVGEVEILSPFSGVLRGLIRSGVQVYPGMKVGDVDPRDNPEYCRHVSDKALAVGGGVLEALLARPFIRSRLW